MRSITTIILTEKDFVDWKKIESPDDIKPKFIKGSIRKYTDYDVVIFIGKQFTHTMKNRYPNIKRVTHEYSI